MIRTATRALLVVLALLVPTSASADIVDRVVARVGDDIVTMSDVARAIPVYIQVIGVAPERLADAAGRREVANEVVQYLIDRQLLISAADDAGVGVSDAEVEQFLAQQRAALGVTEGEFAAELARTDIPYDDFRDFIHGYITRQRMIQLDVVASVSVSDDEVASEIERRYPEGYVDIFIETSHILVPVAAGASFEVDQAALETIFALRAELDAGRSFEEIAAATNPDGTRNTGGRLGLFAVRELVPEYSTAAMLLDIGEISAPVRTPFGYHLIRLERIERRALAEPDDLADRIRYELHEAESSRQEAVYLERLRESAFVQVLFFDFDV